MSFTFDKTEWPDYLSAEKTSMCLVRGLRGMSGEWGKFIATAQAVIGFYQEMTRPEATSLYDEENALALVAASRILDSASTPHSGLAESERRDLTLMAATAYAMYGNFPSAKAVLNRLPFTEHQSDASIAALIAVILPSKIGDAVSCAPNGSHQKRFIEHLNLFHHTGDIGAFDQAEGYFIESLLAVPSPFYRVLYRSARLALHHHFHLSIARIAKDERHKLPAAYVQHLVDASIRLLLPPQYKALGRATDATRPDRGPRGIARAGIPSSG